VKTAKQRQAKVESARSTRDIGGESSRQYQRVSKFAFADICQGGDGAGAIDGGRAFSACVCIEAASRSVCNLGTTFAVEDGTRAGTEKGTDKGSGAQRDVENTQQDVRWAVTVERWARAQRAAQHPNVAGKRDEGRRALGWQSCDLVTEWRPSCLVFKRDKGRSLSA